MNNGICILVNSFDQLEALYDAVIKDKLRVFVSPDMALYGMDRLKDIRIPELFLSSPYILRRDKTEALKRLLDTGLFCGVLLRSFEAFSYILENESYRELSLVTDSNLYSFNSEAFMLYHEMSGGRLGEYFIPCELKEKEIYELIRGIEKELEGTVHSSLVYGRLPVMISAGCIKKSAGSCDKKSGFTAIEDRLNKAFPVYKDCAFCYNVIYNTVPLSLHGFLSKLKKYGSLRLDFTDEDAETSVRIYDFFKTVLKGGEDNILLPYKEYTTGHIKRGVL